MIETLTSQAMTKPGGWIVRDMNDVVVIPQEIARTVLFSDVDLERRKKRPQSLG